MNPKTGFYFLANDSAEPIGPFRTFEDAQRLGPARMALDRDTVRKVDEDGRLHIEVTNISKANVCPYFGREIPDFEIMGLEPDRIYKLYRDPEELAKAAPTFNNIPLLSEHVPVDVNDHQPDLIVGSTGTDAEFKAPYLRNSLVVWVKDAIEGIESGTQKELSCAYRYDADMTSGEFEGETYDGVMRNIRGNHVALVREGRAGSDVVVGDAALPNLKEMFDMSKNVLSRRAVATKGALMVYLRPKLAADTKIDLDAVLKGLTNDNFASRKSAIVTTIRSKAKLAKDANIEDMTTLMDALEPMIEEEVKGKDAEVDADDEESEEEKKEKKEAEDRMRRANDWARDRLPAKDRKGYDALCAGDEESFKKWAEEEGKEKEHAKDEEKVDKKAMDAALAKIAKDTKNDTIREMREVGQALKDVRPYVGELSMAFDSAPEVYKAALEALKIDITDVPAAGYKPLLKALPVPGSEPARKTAIAADAATAKSYAERFPGAERIAAI